MNGMTTSFICRPTSPAPIAACRRISAATGSPTCISRCASCRAERFPNWVANAGKRPRRSMRRATRSWRSRAPTSTPRRSGSAEPDLFEQIVDAGDAARPRAAGSRRRKRRSRRDPEADDAVGKLSWDAIPVRPADPDDRVGRRRRWRFSAVLVWVVAQGSSPYLWREWITSVDHKRIGVMYSLLAMVMLLRGFSDAIMMRAQQALAFHGAGLSAARALRPDLLRARHHHDLLRRDAVHDRADEFRGAAAARRSRCRLSDAQFGQLLADRDRRAAGQHLAGGRRIRPHRLAALSAAVRADLFAGRRCRLLSVGAADLGRRHAAVRHQPRHDDAEDARAAAWAICGCRCSAGPRWRPTC